MTKTKVVSTAVLEVAITYEIDQAQVKDLKTYMETVYRQQVSKLVLIIREDLKMAIESDNSLSDYDVFHIAGTIERFDVPEDDSNRLIYDY